MNPSLNIRTERQEQILDATQSMIAEHGVESVSLAEIAKITGLSRPAIYQYFASKEHLLAELVINEMADLSNAIDERIAKFNDPLERIRIWMHYSLAHLASADHRIIRQISISSLPEESRGMIKDLHGHFMMALLSPLRELGVKDVTATSNLIFASVAAAANRIDEGSDFSTEASTLEKYVVSGIEGTLDSAKR
ncbi:MAG: TetR/AcrR family transcriptional regulator [Micrococcales bacterium]